MYNWLASFVGCILILGVSLFLVYEYFIKDILSMMKRDRAEFEERIINLERAVSRLQSYVLKSEERDKEDV